MSSLVYFSSVSFAVFLCLYTAASIYTLIKVTQGDITLKEAGTVWGPLAACLLAGFFTIQACLTPIFGLAGLWWVIRLALQQRAALAGERDEVLGREVTKWKQTLANYEENPTAHLYLGNALVEQRQYDSALVHYRRALALDARCARDLDMYLAGRSRAVERRFRSRLPDLEQMARQTRPDAPTAGPFAR